MSSTNINSNSNDDDDDVIEDNNPVFDGEGKLPDDHNEKKEKLKCLVIDAITKECTDSSIHDDIIAISKGLHQDGKELELTILTGGLCNYSYKVHFATTTAADNNEDSNNDENNSSNSDVALFAKLTFGEPILFPGTPCSQDRTQFEYEALELFANVSPYPHSVCTPYFCIDIIINDDDEDGDEKAEEATNSNNSMKLLVTQFAPAGLEEQCANKFIDGGVIDTKFAFKLAKSLGSLHNISSLDSNYNKDFNKEMKPFFYSLTNIMESIFNSFFEKDEEENEKKDEGDNEKKEEDSSIVTKLGKEIGKEQLDLILKNYREILNRTDCYIHGDCHVFNMLVESTPSMESIIQTFQDDTDVDLLNDDDNGDNGDTTNGNGNGNSNGITGDFTLIDWEMSHVGPIGKDIGFFFPFPLACVFAHAINGDYAGSSKSILKFLDVLWTEYSTSSIMLPPNSGIDSIDDIYYQVLGFCGCITIAYCALGFHMEYLPIEENRTDDLAKVKDSLGIIGLKFMNIGFGTSKEEKEKLSLTDLKKKFNDIIQEEIDRIVPVHESRPKKKPSRRCSLLRQSGRRVSDAHTWLSMAASLASDDDEDGGGGGGGGRRTSSSSSSIDPIAAATAATTARMPLSSVGSRRASIVQFEKLLIDIEDGY